MMFQLKFSPAALVFLIGLPLTLPAVAAEDLVLTERGGSRLSLELKLDERDPASLKGRFEFARSGCSGAVAATSVSAQGEVLLAVEPEAGKCRAPCTMKLVPSERAPGYWLKCRGGDSYGRFEVDAAAQRFVASMKQYTERQAAETYARNQRADEERARAMRVPCWACSIADEGLLGNDLIGRSVFEHDGGRYFKVEVTGVRTAPPAIGWKQPGTDKSGWNDARLYYTELSKGQHEATARWLQTYRSGKSARPTEMGTGTAPPDSPRPWMGATLTAAQLPQLKALAAWKGRDPNAAIDGRTFFDVAGLDRKQLEAVLAEAGVSVRQLRPSAVQALQLTTKPPRVGWAYVVALCSEGRPWCSGDHTVGEAVLLVLVHEEGSRDEKKAGSISRYLWMMNQSATRSDEPFYCSAGDTVRFYCRRFAPRSGWLSNAPFTLREIPGLGDTLHRWIQAGYAESMDGFALVDRVTQALRTQSVAPSADPWWAQEHNDRLDRARQWADEKPGRNPGDYRGP